MTAFRLAVFLLVAYFAVVIACALAGLAADRAAIEHRTQQIQQYSTTSTEEQGR